MKDLDDMLADLELLDDGDIDEFLEELELDQLLLDSQTEKDKPMDVDTVVAAGVKTAQEFNDARNRAAFVARASSRYGLKDAETHRAWAAVPDEIRQIEDPSQPDAIAKFDRAIDRVYKDYPDLFDLSASYDPTTQKPRYQNDIIENDDPRMQSTKFQMENQEAMQRSAKAKLRRGF